MLRFGNPLDTDVAMPGWEIGSSTGDNLVYAGPKYGEVTQERYDELLQSGKIDWGQQAVELYGERFVQTAKDITPDKVKDVFGGGGHLLRDFANSKVGKVAGKAWEISGLSTQVKQTLDIIGAPVEIAHKASKLRYKDGRLGFGGRGIGRAPLGIFETVATAGGGTIKRGVKKGLNLTDDLLRANQPAYAYATVNTGLLSESANIAQKSGASNIFKESIAAKNIFYSIDKTDPAYIKWRTEGEKTVTAKVAAGETENLGRGLTHYVDKKTGTRYRLGTRYKDGKVQYTNIDLDKRGVRDLKRATSIELDDQTLLNLFKGNQKTVDSYKAVNKKVIKKIQDAISEHNTVNNLKGADKLTLEHVFDVQHYGRLGEALPPFSGKGADELFNLTILGKRANISSGAKARYMDSGEALIKAIREGTFIDYHQTTSDFIKHNLAKKVKNMTTEDWKRFTDLAIANPSTNAHTLLVNFN